MSPVHVSTIEEEYEYRINRLVKKVMKEYDFVPKNGNDLMEFLWLRATVLGKLLIDDMCEWKDEDDWLKELDQ